METSASPDRAPADRLDAATLCRELRARLGDGHDAAVVWVRDGSETIVHLDRLRADIAVGVVTVSAEFESDQLPRQPLEVALALPTPEEPPGFFAVTPRRARGDPALAARWGATFAQAMWTAIVELADSLYGSPAAGIAAADGAVLVYPAPVLSAVAPSQLGGQP